MPSFTDSIKKFFGKTPVPLPSSPSKDSSIDEPLSVDTILKMALEALEANLNLAYSMVTRSTYTHRHGKSMFKDEEITVIVPFGDIRPRFTFRYNYIQMEYTIGRMTRFNQEDGTNVHMFNSCNVALNNLYFDRVKDLLYKIEECTGASFDIEVWDAFEATVNGSKDIGDTTVCASGP